MMDAKLKPWLLEVNHLPSFNSDTETDEKVKFDLIRDIYSILKMSIENRKKVYREMRSEQAKQMQQGAYKRINVKDHSERVRFDPT